MNPAHFQSSPPYPWFPMVPPEPPKTSAFWDTRNVRDRIGELQNTLNLAKAMQKELEILKLIKESKGDEEEMKKLEDDSSVSGVLKYLKQRGIDVESQELVSVEATNALMSKLRAQLEPFRFVIDQATPWEEKSAAVRLEEKIKKSKRNKVWRKRKRRRIGEMIAKERERFDEADREADEWRAREIAKEMASQKVEKMKEIAKQKAKEEKERLESELELVLIVEKLQELRSLRIQKLKKQGHFLPEEDDKFLERVQAAVEEEEKQALTVAATDAAKDAIAAAEESTKTQNQEQPFSKDTSNDNEENKEMKDQITPPKDDVISDPVTDKDSSKRTLEGQGQQSGTYDSVANLPLEFYHYYHGSNTDMGTLIEVRRTWDAYIRPGGSRIPGHWVQPPPPADQVWASYLVRPWVQPPHPEDQAKTDSRERPPPESSVPATPLKPEEEFICTVCLISCNSEKVFKDHFLGKMHKAREERLRALTKDKDSGKKEDYKFWCELCSQGAYLEKIFESHLNGKRHQARLRFKGLTEGAQVYVPGPAAIASIAEDMAGKEGDEKRKGDADSLAATITSSSGC